MTRVRRHGFEREEVERMDLRAFQGLYESCCRVEVEDKTEDVWVRFIVQNGSKKNVEQLVKGWQKASTKKEQNDMRAFLAKFDKGM